MNTALADDGSRRGADPTAGVGRCRTEQNRGAGVRRGQTAAFIAGAALLALSCGGRTPEEVWVRDPDSKVSVRITLGETPTESLRVGRWIDLHADRTSGRWIRVRSRDLEPGVRWLVQPPPAEEPTVESNVRWFVEPAGGAEFNLPSAGDRLSRRVRFSAPGTYIVWAQSHTWGGETVRSNRITVTIRP